MEKTKITVETTVHKSIDQVWELWTTPKHIMEWNSAQDDWYCPSAENDLRVGGAFSSVMAAKDGSYKFDFAGIYDEVIPGRRIAYTLGDGRKVEIDFAEQKGGVYVRETFDAEDMNSIELQRNGWQSILDHFKRYAESQA